jgi:hypothetical protein
MRVSKLIDLLEKVPADSDVTVRTVERGEACLTVELTDVEWSREDGVMLIGDLDEVNGRGMPPKVGDN